jgi:inorganic pyrophosphatase
MSNFTVIFHILSLLGTPGTLYFRGAGCTNFLIYYEDMCEDYNVTEREQIRRFPRYYAEHISISIKGFKAYENRDWKRLKKVILKQFRKTDL